MALEVAPPSTQSDGQWLVQYVPSGSNPLSVAILNGGTSKPLTYSFTDSGFKYDIAQANVDDKRLTLIQNLARPGRKTETLEVQYVASTLTTAAQQILTEGTAGFLVIRRGTPNATTNTIGQIVDVITFVAGAQRPDAPAENGLDTITQGLYITAPTQRAAVLVA